MHREALKDGDRIIRLVAPVIGDEEIAQVVDVLRSGQLAQGPVVAQFEREFAELFELRHAVAVNSGTAALHCALHAVGISEGDEVLTSPFTFAASASPILMQRGRVRFVDIDSRTFNADISGYAGALQAQTKAVIGVDLFGLPFDRTGVEELRRREVVVIADACQSIGAAREGIRAGTKCDAGAFSFYATKNVMTGEGGMVVTDDDGIAERARRFRQHGQTARYEHAELGYNYRLTDVLAAIGTAQLRRLPALTAARRANASYYDAELAGVPGVRVPFVPDGVEHAYHQYSILVDETQTRNGKNRDAVRQVLKEAGVMTGVYYHKPLHLQPLFGGPHRLGEFPVAEWVADRVMALPVHPLITAADRARVVAELRSAVGAP